MTMFMVPWTGPWHLNKHGVEVNSYGTPRVCCGCYHRDFEDDGEGGHYFEYCSRGVWFPKRKGTCAKQDPIKVNQ